MKAGRGDRAARGLLRQGGPLTARPSAQEGTSPPARFSFRAGAATEPEGRREGSACSVPLQKLRHGDEAAREGRSRSPRPASLRGQARSGGSEAPEKAAAESHEAKVDRRGGSPACCSSALFSLSVFKLR